jgi:hypothetical protein
LGGVLKLGFGKKFQAGVSWCCGIRCGATILP